MSENGATINESPESSTPQPRILIAITAHPDNSITLESPLPTDRMVALMFQMLVQSVMQKPEPKRIIPSSGYVNGLRNFLGKKPRGR